MVRDTLKLSRNGPRALLAARAQAPSRRLIPQSPPNEQAALQSAGLFTAYLKACRDERYAMRLLPPGRFLMPGDLAGSPALTFAPLDCPTARPRRFALGDAGAALRILQRCRRTAFYASIFARPRSSDRLVDALAAFNAGPMP